MDIPVEKNKEYVVEIIDNGIQGEGIARINNYVIFVPDVIKGEKVKILILKVLSSHAFAKLVQIIDVSNQRKETDCNSYKRCGGCNLRHVKYEETLNMKKNMVQNLFDKNISGDVKVSKTVGMENPFFYRNKAIYPVQKGTNGKAIFGVYANRTHEIIKFDECMIQTKISQEIAKFIIDFINRNNISVYDEMTNRGAFRHIIIKCGMRTDEIMCIFVLNEEKLKMENELVLALLDKFSNIKTIIKNVNSKNTNVILGNKNVILYGNGYIQDRLRELFI